MKNRKRYAFLNLSSLPQQLTGQEAAWLLGFSARDISALVATDLLHPLPKVAGSGRHFDLGTVKKLAANRRWLDQATEAAEAARKAKRRKRSRSRA